MRSLVFDTETTDLIDNRLIPIDRQPRVFEFFGLVIDERFEIVDRYHSLFDPRVKLNPKVISLTGMTDEGLVGQPFFESKAQEIADFINGCDEAVAHNMSFDESMLGFEMIRAGTTIKWNRRICTVEQSEHYLGYRLSLDALHKHFFGEGFAGAHRAEQDVEATMRCFVEMRKRGDC